MKLSEIVIGNTYLTKVGGALVAVVAVAHVEGYRGRASSYQPRVRVRRCDTGRELRKPRTAAALRPAPAPRGDADQNVRTTPGAALEGLAAQVKRIGDAAPPLTVARCTATHEYGTRCIHASGHRSDLHGDGMRTWPDTGEYTVKGEHTDDEKTKDEPLIPELPHTQGHRPATHVPAIALASECTLYPEPDAETFARGWERAMIVTFLNSLASKTGNPGLHLAARDVQSGKHHVKGESK